MGMHKENKMLAFGVVVVLAALALLAISGESARGSEPPDEVVAEIHDLVQKTCFDKEDMDPAARDRCSLYVIRTLRNEYAEQQSVISPPPVSAAPPPPGSVEIAAPPTAPTIQDVIVPGEE